MVAASLSCMAVGGAFVEIGKRDIWSPQRIAQERPDVAYHLVAVDFLPPSVVAGRLRWLSALLAKGSVQPLATLVYGLSDTAAAFRRMSQAKHAGLFVDVVHRIVCKAYPKMSHPHRQDCGSPTICATVRWSCGNHGRPG